MTWQVVQIYLLDSAGCILVLLRTLTAHLRSSLIFIIAIQVAGMFPSHTMSVESILPLPHLPNFLITVFVFLIAIWPRRIVDVIPILRYMGLFTILLALLPPTTLPLFSSIKPIHIIIIACSRPVRQRGFYHRPN